MVISQKKLPGNPLLIIAPSGPTYASTTQSKRTKFWNSQLGHLGQIIPVTMHTVNGGSVLGVAQCLEHMINAVRTKVQEVSRLFFVCVSGPGVRLFRIYLKSGFFSCHLGLFLTLKLCIFANFGNFWVILCFIRIFYWPLDSPLVCI